MSVASKLYEKYLDQMRSNSSPTTIKSYQSAQTRFLEFSSWKVSRSALVDWINSPEIFELSQSTHGDYCTAVTSFAEFLMEESVISPKEFKKIKEYASSQNIRKKAKSRALTWNQVAQVQKKIAKKLFLKHYWHAGFYLGLRAEEYGLITMSDWHPDKGHHGVLFVRGKSKGKDKKERMLPFDYATRQWFDTYLTFRASQLGTTAESRKNLFFNYFHHPPKSRSVQEYYQKISDLSGVKHTPHDNRHTCAKRLEKAGIKGKAIQEYLGHEDITTTFNVYLAMTETEMIDEFR